MYKVSPVHSTSLSEHWFIFSAKLLVRPLIWDSVKDALCFWFSVFACPSGFVWTSASWSWSVSHFFDNDSYLPHLYLWTSDFLVLDFCLFLDFPFASFRFGISESWIWILWSLIEIKTISAHPLVCIWFLTPNVWRNVKRKAYRNKLIKTEISMCCILAVN